jgi:hypothetical protein
MGIGWLCGPDVSEAAAATVDVATALLAPCLQMLSARIDAAQQAAQLVAPDEMPVVRDSLSRLHLVSGRQPAQAGRRGAGSPCHAPRSQLHIRSKKSVPPPCCSPLPAGALPQQF